MCLLNSCSLPTKRNFKVYGKHMLSCYLRQPLSKLVNIVFPETVSFLKVIYRYCQAETLYVQNYFSGKDKNPVFLTLQMHTSDLK